MGKTSRTESKKRRSQRCWSSIWLFKPTVEPIIFLCMAGVSMSSIAYQSFIFESICRIRFSDHDSKLWQEYTLLNVTNTTCPFGNCTWLNETTNNFITVKDFCRNHIKKIEYISEHKTASAETSKFLFYG